MAAVQCSENVVRILHKEVKVPSDHETKGAGTFQKLMVQCGGSMHREWRCRCCEMMTQKRQKDPTGPPRPHLDALALSMESGDLLLWYLYPTRKLPVVPRCVIDPLCEALF